MSTITNILGTDKIKDSRAVINANFTALNTDLVAAESDIDAIQTSVNANLPTAGQKAALAGDGGTPGAGNPYVLANSGKFGIVTLTAGETINGATTPVPVYQNKTDNEFYACDANDNTRYKFVGFATSNGTNGNPINVQFSGIVSGFTGLAEGEKYYVQDTIGTIGTTPGTQHILVGIAISETQLVIQRGALRIAGSGTVSDNGASGATTDVAVTCGFRISSVSLSWHTEDTAPTPDVYPGGSMTHANGTTFNAGSISSPEWSVSVISITDTGFTLRFTQNATTPDNCKYTYLAVGEL